MSIKELSSYCILPLLIAGIIYGVTTPYPCIVLIILQFVFTNKQTVGIFLILYGGVIGGVIRSLFPFLPIWGLLLNLIGLFLLRESVIFNLKNNYRSILYLIYVFLVFGISYSYAWHTDYSNQKMIGIIQNGLLFYWGYQALATSSQIKILDFVKLLLVTTILLISYAETMYNIYPSSFVDFNWFRQGLNYTYYIGKEKLIVDYQDVGMYAAYAVSLLFSFRKISLKNIFIISICLYLILMSGTRQALLCVFVIYFLRMVLLNETRSIKKHIFSVLAVIILYASFLLLKSSNIEAVTNTIAEGDEKRMYIWGLAYKLFADNMITGIGLGEFRIYGGDEMPWPHNFFLEVLCECGLMGAVLLLVIAVTYASSSKLSLKYRTPGDNYYFLFIIPLFVRIMVSADFTQSIALFSAIFAASNIKHFCKK